MRFLDELSSKTAQLNLPMRVKQDFQSDMGRQLLSLDQIAWTFKTLTCNFNSKLSLIFLWFATRPLRLEIFDSKSEISFSIFSSSTVFKSTMGWRWRHSCSVGCSKTIFEKVFSRSSLPRMIRKIVTHLEEEKISLPNWHFYQLWETINLQRKISVQKKIKKEKSWIQKEKEWCKWQNCKQWKMF